MPSEANTQYEMTLSLHVLEELGINLYSNVPAVLAEVVANSWDADAKNVHIEIDHDNEQIEITDDGRGMLVNRQVNEVNDKYLRVGYRKRSDETETDEHGNSVTRGLRRPVMGRKGIGKLSLFAIADEFEVHTARNGYKAGFVMSSDDIRKQIGDGQASYYPRVIPSEQVKVEQGTRILLTQLKKNLTQAARNFRRRLARRFGIKADKYDFRVFIDGRQITVEDRDYFHKVQYLWEYGESDPTFQSQCARLEKYYQRPNQVGPDGKFKVAGWLGTAHKSGDLKDGEENINRVVILVREKLAQEDILEEFGEDGVYASYVFGEIHADFLDMDGDIWNDIATSSRQRIIEDDPRYAALKSFIHNELKEIQREWSRLRSREGERLAKQIPAINEWFQTLDGDQRRKARSLFGKINQLKLDDEQRKVLLQNGVIAFETLRHKGELDRLEKLTARDMPTIAKIFYDLDDLESTLYYRIVTERLRVIQALGNAVDDNALEKVLQEHIFKHLWLLDPSWERATEALPFMESSVTKMFEDLDKSLTDRERLSRVDMKYTTSQGKHVIVELKRAERLLDTDEIRAQLNKYRVAFQKVARQHEDVLKPLELVCIVGRNLRDWTGGPNEREVTANTLAAIGARVVTYQQLIGDSEANYREFLERNREAGRISELIRQIKEWEWPDEAN